MAASSTLAAAVGDGSGSIRTSPDGVTWTTRTVTAPTNVHFYDVTWDGTRFVAVGMDYNFTISNWVGLICTSPDGITWTRQYRSTTPNSRLASVASSGGILIAGGDSATLLRSTNGASWTAVSAPGVTTIQSYQGAAYGGGNFVLTAQNNNASGTPYPYNGGNLVFTSTDGLTWTDQTDGNGLDNTWEDMRKTAWLNNKFVSSGWYSKLRTSTDGGQTFTTTRTNNEDMTGLAYGDGLYFAVGQDLDSSALLNLISADGVNWTFSTVPTSNAQNGATFFANTFLTAGNNGEIWQSANVSAPAGFLGWQITNFPTGG